MQFKVSLESISIFYQLFLDNIKQLYGRFSKETRLAVENVRQNQTLLNMRLRKKLPKVSHHTRKTLAQCQKLSDKKDKVEIENSIHLGKNISEKDGRIKTPN